MTPASLPKCIGVPEGPWNSRGLVSLWEIMNIFKCKSLALLLCKLQKCLDGCEEGCRHSEDEFSLPAPNDSELGEIVACLQSAENFCADVGWEVPRESIGIINIRLRGPDKLADYSRLSTELRHAIDDIHSAAWKRKFLQVSQDRAEYLDNPALFGEKVKVAFPSATNDITEAGNCLAAECYVAAVFHLMRAAEVGLWELGRDRQIELARTGKIEFTEWGIIIGQLEVAVKSIQGWRNSRSKEDAHKFYNSVVVEIRAFNDGWRRHAGHARPYIPSMEADEAMALFGHVRRFLVALSEKIREGTYTPLIWESVEEPHP